MRHFVGQRFDMATTPGKSFSAGQLGLQAALGALLGALVGKSIPLQGRKPNLFKPRSLAEFSRPNTQRLFNQESLGALLKSVGNALFGAFGSNVQTQAEQTAQ